MKRMIYLMVLCIEVLLCCTAVAKVDDVHVMMRGANEKHIRQTDDDLEEGNGHEDHIFMNRVLKGQPYRDVETKQQNGTRRKNGRGKKTNGRGRFNKKNSRPINVDSGGRNKNSRARVPTTMPTTTTRPSYQPSMSPSSQPSERPSTSTQPSGQPSNSPSDTTTPTLNPSHLPSMSAHPSLIPTDLPSSSYVPSVSALPSTSSQPSTSSGRFFLCVVQLIYVL